MPFFETKFTNVKVTDINDKIIESGVCNELPKNLILQISSEFDIKVVVSKNNVVQNKFFIKAGKIFDGVNADFDVEVKIFQDLECVWSVKYELSQKEISKVDAELFLKLAHDRGKKVKISHTLGSLIDKLGIQYCDVSSTV